MSETSKFWEDIREAEKLLKPVNELTVYLHPYTLNALYRFPYGKSRRGLAKLLKRLNINKPILGTVKIIEKEK